MTNKTRVLLGLAVFYAMLSLIYLLRLGGQHYAILSNTLFLIPPLVATLSAAYMMRPYRFANAHGKVAAYLTAGLACWFIGETLFFAYKFILHIKPFPSIADVFYLAAYPLLMIGLIKEIRLHHLSFKSFKDNIALVIVAPLTVVLAFLVLYFGVYLAYQSSEPLLNNVVAMAYGIGDLILIVPALYIVKIALTYQGGKLFTSWLLVAVALGCIMAGDLLFAIYNIQYANGVWPYTLTDLTWSLGYSLFAYSFLYTTLTIKEVSASLKK